MAEANKRILREANERVMAGDYEGFLAHCTDDVVWHFVGEQTLRGKAAVRAYMQKTYTRPPRFTVERMIADAEFVTAIGQITLDDDSGRAVRYEYCDVWRVENGKLAELKAFVVKSDAA